MLVVENKGMFVDNIYLYLYNMCGQSLSRWNVANKMTVVEIPVDNLYVEEMFVE